MAKKARGFAVSFVVTVGVGCQASNTPPPESGRTPSSTHFERQPDGTCMRYESGGCPENAPCNPPPPARVDCETHAPIPEQPETPPAPPEPLQKGPTVRIERQEDGTCLKFVDPYCPPDGPTCNPPAPERVDCETGKPPTDKPQTPKAPELPAPSGRAGTKVERHPDGTCWETVAMKCDPHTKCNPPAPIQVECL